jgi:hypothetical protein
MVENLPEDMVYTITTGFYPELFSGNTKWKTGQGKGRKGMQWKAKRGWSKGSLKKIAGKRVDKSGVRSFFERMVPSEFGGGGKSWDEAYEKLSKSEKAEFESYRKENIGQEEGQFASEAEMQEKLTYTKFMGNTEYYKLWGTRVWWQEGMRKNPDKMELDVVAWENMTKRKNLSLYLEKLYTQSEGGLIEFAKKLAGKVFGDAVKEGNLRKDLQTVADEADVPEEERKESGGEKVDAIPKSFQEISKARQADIKYRMKDGTALYLDSTEQSIKTAGQHGILGGKELEALSKTITAAEKDYEGGKEALKKSVIDLFVKNIEIYNKDIRSIVTAGGTKKDSKEGMKGIKKIMQEIEKNNKDEKSGKKLPDARVTVSQMMQHAGLTMGEDKAKDASFKYVIHTVLNLAGSANKNFRQGHLIGNIKGQNTYASIPMRLVGKNKGGTPQFDPEYMANGVAILQGESHLLAIQGAKLKNGEVASTKTANTHTRQIQAFQNGKIIGVGANGQTHGQANAQTNLRMRMRQSTTVTFNPKSFEDIINKLPEVVGNNTNKDKIRDTAKNYMKSQKEHRLGQHGIAKFWAMPYIGLMEYPTKAE